MIREVFESDNVDERMSVLDAPVTSEAMAND